MATKWTYRKVRASYMEQWHRVKLIRREAAEAQARQIIKNKNRYLKIEHLTGVKWFVIGAIHIREAGSPPDWKAVLHNGERIVGTRRKTRLVPKGRGPFATFEEAAVDAIKYEGLDKLNWTDAEGPALTAWALEKFNGFGYRNGPYDRKHRKRYPPMPSPYLWGGTNIQTRGKFVADHVFDPHEMDVQIGGMAVLKAVMELDETARFGVTEEKRPEHDEPIPLARGDERLWHIQNHLKNMNYNPGGLDGVWGGMSSGAIASFLNDRESKIQAPTSLAELHKVFDDLEIEIHKAVENEFVRPVIKERAEATDETVADHADDVKETKDAEKLGFWGSVIAAITTAVTGVGKFLGDASEWLEPLKTMIDGIPGFVWLGLALTLSGALFYVSQKAGNAKRIAVTDFREGRR